MCFSFRQWIVPGNLTVTKRNGALQLLNATLDVQMESTYLKNMGLELRSACPPYVNPAVPAYAEDLFRRMVRFACVCVCFLTNERIRRVAGPS